jgi:hypothetical protein
MLCKGSSIERNDKNKKHFCFRLSTQAISIPTHDSHHNIRLPLVSDRPETEPQALFVSLLQHFSKKIPKTFGGFQKSSYLCTRNSEMKRTLLQ